MTTFVAIYRGEDVSTARLIDLSADPDIVADVAAQFLRQRKDDSIDPVIAQVERGRKNALRKIKKETLEEKVA